MGFGDVKPYPVVKMNDDKACFWYYHGEVGERLGNNWFNDKQKCIFFMEHYNNMRRGHIKRSFNGGHYSIKYYYFFFSHDLWTHSQNIIQMSWCSLCQFQLYDTFVQLSRFNSKAAAAMHFPTSVFPNVSGTISLYTTPVGIQKNQA